MDIQYVLKFHGNPSKCYQDMSVKACTKMDIAILTSTSMAENIQRMNEWVKWLTNKYEILLSLYLKKANPKN